MDVSTKQPIYQQVNSYEGRLVAGTVICLWLGSLIGLFSIDISQAPLWWVGLAVLLRAFLHTGLFITTHEAIHGTIVPGNQHINNAIGAITARLYALLPYPTLAKNHRLHHRHPASEQDPDFYGPGRNNPLLWYANFMKEYLKGNQAWVLLVGMTIIFYTLLWGFRIPLSNIFLFWVIPILISSVQLFCFGIFLPHRQPESECSDRHRAVSSNLSTFWSFVACYHFDYHWEHHEYPNLPWYTLPLAREKFSTPSR
ncbi:MAG: fatty acid desaturase [Cyanophyceae cyanobacterium]